MSTPIFKNEQSRERLEKWYQHFLARAKHPVEQRDVSTHFGTSHVLLAGDATKETLVCLHGSLASSAHLMSELDHLIDHFHIVAVDLPGQSVRGPQSHFSFKDVTLGQWLIEVLDGLGIEQFSLLGVSWGGFVARKATQVAPKRINKLILLVPAGIVGGPIWKGFSQIAWPMIKYRINPTEKNLRRYTQNLFTNWDEDWAHYMGDAIRDFHLDLRIPPVATDKELQELSMPTLVIAAEEDLCFPGEKLLKRMKSHLPSIDAELIPGSKHSPPTTDAFRKWLAERIRSFCANRAMS